MERYLEPVANRRRRLIILGVLLIPVLLSWRIGVVWQLLSCLLPVMLTGTYRVSRLTAERFDTQFHLGFVPLKRHQCRLQAVVTLLTIYQQGQGWGTFFLFGPVQWLIGHVFDYLIPSLGGPYEIWIETAKGRQILAWNGYNQEYYERNLELLRVRTGAEVRLR
ncbi:MAG TPA: hypothetical protein VM165_25620 [Planctomycetaceae bacterium]|nr:hypothetical protein [Planctomycetaceae bacterium]